MNEAIGDFSHAENGNIVRGYSSDPTKAGGMASHTEGAGTRTGKFSSYPYTPSESDTYCNDNSGKWAHAEGHYTHAIGYASHAEGSNSRAEGYASHAEGSSNVAEGAYSHAEGSCTCSTGAESHTEGNATHAIGYGSHAEGVYTIAQNAASHAEGKYNVGTSTDTIHETGIGTDDYNRKNAFEIYTDGRLVAPELTPALINTLRSLITKEYLLSAEFGNSLPTTNPGVGSGMLWNNGGVVTVG